MTNDELRAALRGIPLSRRLAVAFALRSDLKQRDVSDRTGISESHLSQMISGRKGIDAEQRQAIATAFDLSVADLFGGDAEEAVAS